MIKLSIIYLDFTILLAMIDAVRIYIEKGKVENINHKVSTALGVIAWIFTLVITLLVWPHDWPTPCDWLSHSVFVVFSAITCVLVRLSQFNIWLNLYRIFTGTNPTGRLDYVSVKTNSKVDTDAWWSSFAFWQQRSLATLAWALMAFTYYQLDKFNILGL